MPAKPAQIRQLVTGTILVVEEEEALRSALGKMLRRKGCTVIEAADGQTGIDQLRGSATNIDVVLLDLTLPGMSGAEVLGELRCIRPDLKAILHIRIQPGFGAGDG